MKKLYKFYWIPSVYSLFFLWTSALAQDIGDGGTGAGGTGGASGFTDFQTAVNTIKSYVNLLIPLLIGLAVFLFIFGVLKYITASGDETKMKEARNFIVFGIIGIAVMISVWGLVNLLVATFFPDTGLFIPQIKS